MKAATGLRDRKKLATRTALGLAAWRLAVERGSDEVRVDDIAAEAGVSPRTFHNYFTSKEEAMVSVATDRAERICAALRNRPAEEPLAGALAWLFVEQYAGGSGPSEEQRAGLRRAVSARGLGRQYLQAMVATEGPLARAIADRTRTDMTRDLSPHVLAAAVTSAVRAAIVFWLESGTTRSLAETLRQAIEQVVAA
jgi:AcrR family transcriptional regulator